MTMPPSDIEARARALLDALDASDEASIGIFAVAALHGSKYDGPTHGKAKDALRRALASHPLASSAVAWGVICRDGVTLGIVYVSRESAEEHVGPGERIVPLYTSPPSGANPPASRESCPTCAYQAPGVRHASLACQDPFHAERPPVEGLREAFTVAALESMRRIVDGLTDDGASVETMDAYRAYRASRPGASEGASNGAV